MEYHDQTVIYELLSEWFPLNGNALHTPDINIKWIIENNLSVVNFYLSSIYTDHQR